MQPRFNYAEYYFSFDANVPSAVLFVFGDTTIRINGNYISLEWRTSVTPWPGPPPGQGKTHFREIPSKFQQHLFEKEERNTAKLIQHDSYSVRA